MNARIRWLLLIAVLVVFAGGYLAIRDGAQGQRAQLASGYVAHVVCSCRYAGGRDLKSCATDLEPGMEIVRMSDDPRARRVTASVPLLARRSARFAPGYGCSFDD